MVGPSLGKRHKGLPYNELFSLGTNFPEWPCNLGNIYAGLFQQFNCGLQKNIIFSLINEQITSVACYLTCNWSSQDPVHELRNKITS